MTNLKKLIGVSTSKISNDAHERELTLGKTLYKDFGYLFFIESLGERKLSVFCLDPKFEVEINYSEKNINTKCNFCETSGTLCMHEVAALIKLNQAILNDEVPKYIKSSSKKKTVKVKLVNVGEFVSLGDFDKIQGTGFEYPRTFIRRTWYDTFKLLLQDYNEDKISFRVVPQSYRKFKKSVEVKVDEGKVYAKCDCNQKMKHYCEHIFEVMEALDMYNCAILDYLDEERRIKIIQDFSLQKGIDVKDLSQYYKLGIDGTKLVFSPTDKLNGNVFVDNRILGKLKKSIKEITNFKAQDVIKETLADEEKNDFEIGFIISSHYGHPRLADTSMVIPIRGVKTKTPYFKYMKNMALVETDYYATKNQKLIIQKISFLENFNYGHYELSKVFYVLKELFHLLKNEQYLFISEGFNSVETKAKKSDITPVRISEKTFDVSFKVTNDKYIYKLFIVFTSTDNELSIECDATNKEIYNYRGGIIKVDDILYLFTNVQDAEFLQNIMPQGQLTCTTNEFDLFYKNVISKIALKYKVDLSEIDNFKIKKVHLEPIAKKLYLSEESQFIVFKPVVEYNNDIEELLGQNDIVKKRSSTLTHFVRDDAFESSFTDELVAAHIDFEEQRGAAYYYLPGHLLLKNDNFISILEHFRHCNIELFGINTLKKIKFSPQKASISTGIKSGQDWFDVDIEIKFGTELVSLLEVRKSILRKERYVKLASGQLGQLPKEWISKFEKLFRFGNVKKNDIQISKLKFNVIDELFENISDESILEEILLKRKKLKAFKSIARVKVPKQIQGTLRDYQKEGLKWMNFLDEFGWGGILADDMGLGKTLQVITFLQLQANKRKTLNLVIVPTSLLYNWENEIQKFAPDLKTAFYYGIQRDLSKIDIKGLNILITSYGVMMNDIELLKDISFNYVILDESQAIKNPASKRYKAVCLLKAKNRLAMSGTPIENNTFDLYAQMSFLNPGFLGSQKQFKDLYSKAIDVDGDIVVATELQRMINPFLLRRTKEVVATELPPKVEDVLYCEMPPRQRKVYDAFKNKYRDLLLNKIDEEGMGKSKLVILEGLTKLRQICDSPALLPDEEDYGNQSVKVDTLMEHIREKTTNHKIIVFSQFVKMLAIIQEKLAMESIPFEYLDGQRNNKQRQSSVDNFQNNDSVRVFLISLKAGGTGLNLTAADYVYLVDPWWNPAVENQAIDRCHRIGQDKTVIAYRMICKDTIEDKIIKLQQKKLKIAKDIINVEENFIKSIDKNDIKQLFG